MHLPKYNTCDVVTAGYEQLESCHPERSEGSAVL